MSGVTKTIAFVSEFPSIVRNTPQVSMGHPHLIPPVPRAVDAANIFRGHLCTLGDGLGVAHGSVASCHEGWRPGMLGVMRAALLVASWFASDVGDAAPLLSAGCLHAGAVVRFTLAGSCFLHPGV